jgi:septum formation protein
MPDANATPARLYLASASPRRREILQQMGVVHEVLAVPAPPGEDEPQHEGESASDYVVRTALDKLLRAEAWCRAQSLPALPILSADTTVILDGAVLGKPADQAEAGAILGRLAGRRHEVRTAVALWTPAGIRQALSITQVTMRAIAAGEIERYCASGEPYGKAGAYGIQGLAGAFIQRIEGSYSGVMGLPVFETAALLRHAAIEIP